jgi:hypothetical protein
MTERLSLSMATSVAVSVSLYWWPFPFQARLTFGPGEHSVFWTRSFLDWWGESASWGRDGVVFFDRVEQLNDCPPLASFPNLLLWVQPGGATDEQASALGPKGRDAILDYAARENAHVWATCAGFYYSAGSYWWNNSFEGMAWTPHWVRSFCLYGAQSSF